MYICDLIVCCQCIVECVMSHTHSTQRANDNETEEINKIAMIFQNIVCINEDVTLSC